MGNCPCELQGAFPVLEPSFELGLLNGQQDFLESGPWNQPHALEIITRDQLRGINFFGGSFQQEALDEIIYFEVPMA